MAGKCSVCEKSTTKNNSVKYRSRYSGGVFAIHSECEWQVEKDTRIIKE